MKAEAHMKLKDIAEKLELTCRTSETSLEVDVSGGYVSDLLSDVMAHSQAGDLWLTLQAHPNTVAVASLRDLVGIIVVGGREPEAETIAKADQEGIPIFVSPRTAFQLAGRLYDLGIGRE
jgi:hypothetical protein